MSKPYMPLMMGDWIRGTRGMRADVKGVYIGLLIHQYDSGWLPSDLESLTLIEPQVGSVWVSLKDKFEEYEPGKLRNRKLEEVRAFWNKQAKNGEKGGRPKTNNPNSNPKENPKGNHHIDLDYDYVFNKNVAEILNKPYQGPNDRGMGGTGQDVDALILQLLKNYSIPREKIIEIIKAMKVVYQANKWPLPKNYPKLLESITDNDWLKKLKELDQEFVADSVQQAKNGKRQQAIDDIGTSLPGSLG